MKYKKLYFARFTDKMTNQMFYKFGYTGNGDAYDRFKSEGRYWYIKIMTSATGPEVEVYDQEARFKREFPKNLYVKRKFKGITEIAQLNRDQVSYVFEEFKKLQQKWGALEYRRKMMAVNPSWEKP